MLPKSLQLLQVLDPKEYRNFKRKKVHLLTPNEHRLLDIFLRYCKITASRPQHSDDFDAWLADKMKQAQIVVSDEKLRKMKSKILRLVEDYLIEKKITHKSAFREYMLSRIYYEGHMQKFFSESRNKLLRKLPLSYKDAPLPRGYIEASQQQMAYFMASDSTVQQNLNKLIEAKRKLENHFLLQRFLLHVEWLIHKNSFTTDIEYDGKKDWELYKKRMHQIVDEKHHPASHFFDWCLHLLHAYSHASTWEVFDQLFDEYPKYASSLDLYEHRMLMKLIRGIALRLVDLANVEHTKKVLAIYQLSLKEGLMPSDNTIEGMVFMNIAIIAIRAGKHKWQKQFVDQYQHYLDQEIRECIVSYCRAYQLYEQSRQNGHRQNALLEEASSLLEQTSISVPHIGIRIRSLKVRIYYEFNPQKAEDTADYLYRSVKNLNKLQKKRIERYRKFARFVQRLVKAKSSTNKKLQLQALEEDLDKSPKPELHFWLSEKLGELRSPSH